MASPPFHAYIDRRDGLSVVVLEGELDLASRDEFRDVLADAEAGDGSQLVLDLGGLTFIDSSGLHVVSVAADRAAAQGRRLAVVRPGGLVSHGFEITRLAGRVDWLDDAPV
jgi:anti-sigma B factor antagonist